jgi:hypothetical protein
MKKDYIIPTIFLIKCDEESKLLSNSLQNADSEYAAPDLKNINSMDGNTDLNIDNSGNVSEGDFAKKNDWFFDDNAFSDFR